MRRICLLICALTLSGCAWLGFGDDSDTVATAETQAAEVNKAPETTVVEEVVTPAQPAQQAKQPAKVSKTTKGKRGVKSEAQIKAELDAMGKKLAAQSGRTLLPNKSKPDYKQVGGQWVASFIDVDSNNVTTELRPGANGQYVGMIRYQEKHMECTGATKQAAMSGGNCRQVKTRNLNELIRYDGHEWQD